MDAFGFVSNFSNLNVNSSSLSCIQPITVLEMAPKMRNQIFLVSYFDISAI